MKFLNPFFTLYLLSSTSVALSFLVVPSFVNNLVFPINVKLSKQAPLMNIPNIALPPFNGGSDKPSKDSDAVIISDVIGKDRTINVFAGFTRNIASISKRLEDGEQNTTVLAPLNSQIQKLPRKPWEDPKDYETLGEQAYDGAGGEDRAQRNLQRFVEAHVLPASPWNEGDRVESLGGGKVWWENKDGQKIV